jgi:putative NADH-flavin reductase
VIDALPATVAVLPPERFGQRTLTIFGASGGTGRELVGQALAAGFDVRAVVRRPDAILTQHPRLSVLAFDFMTDRSALRAALSGTDAVLSALGSRAGRQATDLYSRGIGIIGAAMQDLGLCRLLVVSAMPVSPDGERSMVDRLLIHPLLHQFFGGSYDDLRRMETWLNASNALDWTVFRPPRLLDGPATGTVRTAVASRLPGAWSIRRADLAAAMLARIDDQATYRTAVNIAQ